eukprot:COSAG04_NODE_542_length_12865_cov_44.119693_15_plen_522_part_00
MRLGAAAAPAAAEAEELRKKRTRLGLQNGSASFDSNAPPGLTAAQASMRAMLYKNATDPADVAAAEAAWLARRARWPAEPEKWLAPARASAKEAASRSGGVSADGAFSKAVLGQSAPARTPEVVPKQSEPEPEPEPAPVQQHAPAAAGARVIDLPLELMERILRCGHLHPEEHPRGSGRLHAVVGPRELGRLLQTCKHFSKPHGVAAEASGASGFVQQVARNLIVDREKERGCQRAGNGLRARRRDGESWLQMLHRLDCFDREPLDFESECVPPLLCTHSDDPTGVPLGVVEAREHVAAVVTAAAGTAERHRMRDGVHYARITLLRPGEPVSDAYRHRVLCVGVVQADFDYQRDGDVAELTDMGWAWMVNGHVKHDSRMQFNTSLIKGLHGWKPVRHGEWGPRRWRGRPQDRECQPTYSEPDVLGLELDLDRGILTSFCNGVRVGIIADGLHERRFRSGAPCEYRWFVSMSVPGARFKIEHCATPDCPHIRLPSTNTHPLTRAVVHQARRWRWISKRNKTT